jgi:hypothetical protein
MLQKLSEGASDSRHPKDLQKSSEVADDSQYLQHPRAMKKPSEVANDSQHSRDLRVSIA